MTNVYGVRTVVVGGRPESGPMQAVGGSRGAVLYTADDLDVDIDWVNGQMDLNNNTANETRYADLRSLYERESGMDNVYASFNLRDQIRENDTVPLQFKYEAANCRIYVSQTNPLSSASN